MGLHAERILQPSQFKRTLKCPGWGQFCDKHGLEPSPPNQYTMEGSIAHYLGERCLHRGDDAEVYLGHTGYYIKATNGCSIHKENPPPNKDLYRKEIDDEMCEAVQSYLDRIREKRAKTTGAKFFVEKKLDLTWLIPGMFGTADHLIIEPLNFLYVDDYKHGAGVLVEAGTNVGDNEQSSIYALGAIGDSNPHMVYEVEAAIHQPRARTGAKYSAATYPVEYLIAWGHDVLVPAARKAMAKDAELYAGAWCQWCPAEKVLGGDGKYLCPARREQQLQVIDIMFPEGGTDTIDVRTVEPVPPTELSAEQLDRALLIADMMETWVKAVREEGFNRLDKGAMNAPSQFKLVLGNMGNRAWADEEVARKEAKRYLKDADMVEPAKLKTPAKLETALKKAGKQKPADAKAIIEQLTVRPPAKKIMVPADDPRPVAAGSIDEMFGDEE